MPLRVYNNLGIMQYAYIPKPEREVVYFDESLSHYVIIVF